MTEYFSLNIAELPALRGRFAPGAEAQTFANLTDDGIALMNEARAAGPAEADALYVYVQQGWWTAPNQRREFRVPHPGADLRLAGLYGQITAADALMDGAHPDHTYVRITEQVSHVQPDATQRIGVLHTDMTYGMRGARYAKPVAYLPQDGYADMTAEWLRGYRGARDTAYRHIERQRVRALEAAERIDLTLDAGDEAYQAWLARARATGRFWAAAAHTIVRSRVGQPHMGRANTGPVAVDRVFPRAVFYRPGWY